MPLIRDAPGTDIGEELHELVLRLRAFPDTQERVERRATDAPPPSAVADDRQEKPGEAGLDPALRGRRRPEHERGEELVLAAP